VARAARAVAATGGDRALYDEVRGRLEKTAVAAQREMLIQALGRFRDPALVDAALAYAVSGALRPTEMFEVPQAVGSWVGNEERPYRFLEENYEAIKRHVPEPILGFMPGFAAGCSDQRLARARAFFAQPAHRVPGTDRQLHKVAEQVGDCVRLRAREGAAVAAYLKGLPR
jgi:hypothetical protein